MPTPSPNQPALDPHLKQQITVTYAYMAVGMSYLLVFAPLFIFFYHKYWLGALHALDVIIIAALFLHVQRTKTVAVAAIGLCAVAVSTITLLTIEGGADASGVYFVLPASIFIFFLAGRRRGTLWVLSMFTPLALALVASVLGLLTLPYHHLNFLLFLFSYALSLALLYLYATEKDKLDHRLRQSLEEVRTLAKSLEYEKASIEEKVQLRTQQYKEERAKLGASIDSLRVGFIILDHSLTVLSINEAARRILTPALPGKPPGPVPATMTMTEIVNLLGGSFSLVKEVTACMKARQPVHAADIRFGSHFLAITITPVIDDQSVIGAAVLLEDVTDAKALERSRDEFFSIASHELRTPLTAIMGNASMARQYYERMDKNDIKGVLDDIDSSGKRLIGIVNDFLDTSRLEQGKLAFVIEPVDALALVQEAVQEVKDAKIAGKLRLQVEATQKTVMVQADRNRLRQIVTNLLGNAIKYTPVGSITIALRPEGSDIEISVADTGKGIPVESQHLLFRKFQQASNNILTRDTTQSTGLGLYIAKMLAESMKGSLYLKSSEVGKGTVFALKLPAA
jgi:signal transduction histidine kinase